MRSEVDFRPLMLMKGKIPEKYKDKFCLFHNANGHTTAMCFDLKDEIEFLIRRGKLTGYRKDADRGARSLTERSKARSIRSRETHILGGSLIDL